MGRGGEEIGWVSDKTRMRPGPTGQDGCKRKPSLSPTRGLAFRDPVKQVPLYQKMCLSIPDSTICTIKYSVINTTY